MNTKKGRPTLRDVARAAGLSVTQTSRALNDHWDVAESTKELTRKVAAEVGYVPNLEARRLKTGDTRLGAIGLVLPQAELRFSDAFFAETLSGIVEEATRGERELRLAASLGDSDDPTPYREAIHARQVDGFVVVRTQVRDPRVELLRELQVPFVTSGRTGGSCDFPFVDDSDDSMRPVVDHLVGLGHRRILCVAEPKRYGKSFFRYRAFENAMVNHGIEIDDDLVIEADFHQDSGFGATRALLELADRPTAVVAFNDLLALGAISAVRDAGLRVPEDVSVTGFDDIPAAHHTSPGLTTLHQPAWEIGSLLCRQLLDAIDDTATVERQVLLQPGLIERASTAAAPKHP